MQPVKQETMEFSKLPVAELFESTQGEGVQSGIAMTFIRLAGCNIGKPYTEEARKSLGLEFYQERCTDWNHNSFSCDTNYKISKRLSVEELLTTPEVLRAEWVSLTGGEPLIHNLAPLLHELDYARKGIHIETSGTVNMPDMFAYRRSISKTCRPIHRLFITVSPKQGVLQDMLDRADEIRVLVDKDFDEKVFLDKFKQYIDCEKLWISPINDLVSLNYDNVQKCLELQSRYRKLRLSTQMHKVWQVR